MSRPSTLSKLTRRRVPTPPRWWRDKHEITQMLQGRRLRATRSRVCLVGQHGGCDGVTGTLGDRRVCACACHQS